MLDRTTCPPLSPLTLPRLLPYSRQRLDNGIELVRIHDASQNVFKIDVQFEAGVVYQPQPLVASTTMNMLNEGTRRHTAEEIAETFDYYGSYVDFNCGLNKTEVSLISLCKYAGETLGMLAELLTESIVPEKELEICLRNRKQEFLVNSAKTSYMAKCRFAELLFGEDHPYANRIAAGDYDRLSAPVVRSYCHDHIHAGNCRIIACGNVDDRILDIITKEFSRLPRPEHACKPADVPFRPVDRKREHCRKEDTVQTSIRIGKTGVRLGEKDYAGFMLLNTVLGGYFGSRLMSNIREDKGYTYGISSFNVSMPRGSYWCISTDVNNEYTEATVGEILKEVKRLQTEPVGQDELDLVKNYMHGDLLREIDGVFSQSDALKHKLNYGLDNTIYQELLEAFKACTAEDLLRLANLYLDTDEMYLVTAGK